MKRSKSTGRIHKRLYEDAIFSLEKKEKQMEKLLQRPKSRKLPRRRYLEEKRRQDEIFEKHYQEAFKIQQKLVKRDEEVRKKLRDVQNKSYVSEVSKQLVGDRDHRGFRTLHAQMYAEAKKRIEEQFERDEKMYGFSMRPNSSMSTRSASPTKARIEQPDYERSWSRTPFLSRFEEQMKQREAKRLAKQEGFLKELHASRPFMSPHSKTLMKNKDGFWKTIISQ